jgi:hypothetical protein
LGSLHRKAQEHLLGGVNLGIWILLLPSVLKFSQSRKKKLAA